MAKGALAKEIITKKILTTFEGAFVHEKEIRIPMSENGEIVEIKCVLTCAKTNVGGAVGSLDFSDTPDTTATAQTMKLDSAPSEQEKANVAELMSKLGL